MKVVLINGSPREKGCTYTALEEIASSFRRNGIDYEIIQATVESSEIKAIADRIVNADGLIVGSPVYYASASGLCTEFMDKLFSIIGGKMRFKPAAAIASCRRGGASATFDQLNKYFTISEMVVVSSNYWNQVHGNTPDEVREDAEGMQTMRLLGDNMSYVIRAFDKASLPFPEKEARIKTNFIR